MTEPVQPTALPPALAGISSEAPADHAYTRFLPKALAATAQHRSWNEDDGPLPVMYIGHGAPPLLENDLWMNQLLDWSLAMPKPKSVLMISAHWESAPLSLSASEAASPLVYDFGGFPDYYYRMTYRTPDATQLLHRVASAMPDSEPVHHHVNRGLDHGAWVPLKVMYPAADVPVLQLSLPTHDPARLLDLGARLQELRAEGTLVIGSGFMTHGLPFLRREHFMDPSTGAPGWSKDFDAWAQEKLTEGDVESLANYHHAPGMPYAHPTPEHFSPLFVALGASGAADKPVDQKIDGMWMGLAKRSFQAA